MRLLELSQEITRFQDALNGTQMDFTTENPEMLSEVVDEVSDILKDIKEMCEIDEKCFEDTLNDIHLLLLNKTLLCSKEFKDEERRTFYDHVCNYMPSTGWNFYVRLTGSFNWLTLVKKSWNEESTATQKFIFESILKVTQNDNDAINIKVFYLVLEEFISVLLTNVNDFNSSTDEPTFQRWLQLISAAIEPQTELEALERLIDILTYFCTALSDYNTVEQADRLHQLLQLLIKHNFKKFGELSLYRECTTNLLNCSAAMEKIMLQNHISQSLQILKEFQTVLSNEVTIDYNDDEDVSKDLKLVDAHVLHCEGSLIRILGHLRMTHSNECLQCLLRNYIVLKSNHVLNLVELLNNHRNEEIAKSLMQIIELAFKSWPFNVQDRFRNEIHRQFPSIDFSLNSSKFTKDLTRIVNLLAFSFEMDKLNSISSELSFLCFQNPKKTVTAVMTFAVESGQEKIASKLFCLLEASFESAVDNESLGTAVLFRLIQSDLTPNQLTNLVSLTGELVMKNLLKPCEILRKLMGNLSHNHQCFKTLFIVEKVIKSASEQDLKVIYENDALIWILLLTLGRILNDCATLDLNELQPNILSVKQQVIDIIGLLSRDITTFEYAKGHKLCWLFEKLQQLSPSILGYFDQLFTLTEELLPNVNNMDVSELLAVICSCENDSRKMRYLKICITNTAPLDVQNIPVAVAKILPRMTKDESIKLIDVLLNLIRPQTQHSAHSANIIIIHIVVNSVQLLLKSCHDQSFYLQAATANCSTIIKDIMCAHQPPPNPLWISSVYLVATLTKQLGTISKLGELLLMDLLKMKSEDEEFQCMALHIVKKLNNSDLTDQVAKLFKTE